MALVISSGGKISKVNDEKTTDAPVVADTAVAADAAENEPTASIDDVLSAVNELGTTSELMSRIKHIAEALDEFLDKVRFEDAIDGNKPESESDKADKPKGDVSDIDLETPLEDLFN